jgi:hypothetical protein
VRRFAGGRGGLPPGRERGSGWERREGLVVGVDPAGVGGKVGEGKGDLAAEEKAGGGVGGVEAFVGVEAGEGFGVVGDAEDVAGNEAGGGVCGRKQDEGGVMAEDVEAAMDGGGAEEFEAGDEVGEAGGSAAGVEGSVDEEERQGDRGSEWWVVSREQGRGERVEMGGGKRITGDPESETRCA